jgi:hypothetical protein
MGVWAGIITGIIGAGVKLIGSTQSPNYPSPPKLNKLPVQQAKHYMEDYELARMNASKAAWQARFPLLYQGGKYEIDDIRANQQGKLSPVVSGALRASGLEMPKEGDQYKLSADIGLSPITLAQRTSQAVTRQIAMNPEWTNKISGGTLATMIANNYQNANAYSQFIGSQQTAMGIASAQRSMYNTQALTAGLLGVAGIGAQAYANQQNPLNRPLDPTAYRSDVTTPGYYTTPSQPQPPQPSGYPAGSPIYDPYQYNSGTMLATGTPPSSIYDPYYT